MAASDTMTATGRTELRESRAIVTAIALSTVKTGHNSVPPTVRMNSGRIGPGTTIQIARKSTTNASVKGTQRVTLGFPIFESTFAASQNSTEHHC
jgi:hypothetical protein